MPTKKKVDQPKKSKSEMGVEALAYLNLVRQSKELSSQAEKIKAKLKDYVNEFKPKGKENEHESYRTIVSHGDKEVELAMTARTGTQEKIDFEPIINKHPKLSKFKKKLVKTAKYLDVNALKELVDAGDLTEADASALVDLVTNHAFTAKLVK